MLDGERDDRRLRGTRIATAVWVVAAVAGVVVAVISLMTRADCPPGVTRLFDLTPFMPYVFGLSGTAAAVMLRVMARRPPGRVLTAVAIVALLVSVYLLIAMVSSAVHDGTGCWNY